VLTRQVRVVEAAEVVGRDSPSLSGGACPRLPLGASGSILYSRASRLMGVRRSVEHHPKHDKFRAPVRVRLTRDATTYKSNTDDQLCWSKPGTSSNACGSPPTGATVYGFGPNGNETTAGSVTMGYDLENRMTSWTSGATAETYS
jgi:hypothetical protein